MKKIKECDDNTFFNASIDFLVETFTEKGFTECQKENSSDTDDNYEKIEPYERKTTEER